jgi:tetratricopeptide (TPR) repeat protein
VILSLMMALSTLAADPAFPVPEADRARFAECARLAETDPARAVESANGWRIAGGGISARHCLALAYVQLELWAPAATVFEQAAADAEAARDPRRHYFRAQAGAAWASAGEPTKAVESYDAALTLAGLAPAARAALLLDRAAALVTLGNLTGARTGIDEALRLAPDDATGLYYSAALARRQQDLTRAAADIARARALAPADPDILLLAGTIAGLAGDGAEAERLYRRVAELAPDSEAGRAARESLDGATEQEVATPPPPPPPQSR